MRISVTLTAWCEGRSELGENKECKHWQYLETTKKNKIRRELIMTGWEKVNGKLVCPECVEYFEAVTAKEFKNLTSSEITFKVNI